jgi:hypothetical protein
MSGTGRPDLEQPYRVIAIGNDGKRLIFGDGLDIVEAYKLYRRLRSEKGLPPVFVEQYQPNDPPVVR